MAWYALYKWFIPWRKTPYIDWIQEYKKTLYKEWFDSLGEDEREIYLERLKQKKEKEKEHVMELLHFLYNTFSDAERRCWMIEC